MLLRHFESAPFVAHFCNHVVLRCPNWTVSNQQTSVSAMKQLLFACFTNLGSHELSRQLIFCLDQSLTGVLICLQHFWYIASWFFSFMDYMFSNKWQSFSFSRSSCSRHMCFSKLLNYFLKSLILQLLKLLNLHVIVPMKLLVFYHSDCFMTRFGWKFYRRISFILFNILYNFFVFWINELHDFYLTVVFYKITVNTHSFNGNITLVLLKLFVSLFV